MLDIRSLTKHYAGQTALDGVSLSVAEGAYLSLLGPSGSGKSTLLRLIAGYEAPDEGQVALDGRSLTTVPAHERGIGFVSQGFALFPHLSVFDSSCPAARSSASLWRGRWSCGRGFACSTSRSARSTPTSVNA
jgi:ABC-type Fe3+/spermidine/putrescine transport system ATPase subunit